MATRSPSDGLATSPDGGGLAAGHGDGLATDVRTVATWTLFCRSTGFIRVAVMAAVLGPTYFGNLFLVALAVPAAAQELFLGVIITVLLVPALVSRIDAGEPEAATRLANGMLGILLLVSIILVGLILAAGGFILDLITLTVDDPLVRADQQRLGWPLLVILMPQICLQVIIFVAIAVQNAHGRFALSTAAPAIENFGMLGVLLTSAWLYGAGIELQDISMGQLLLLTIGSTGTVAAHAAVQWWGALRCGIRLAPTAAWRDPHIRQIFRMAAPSAATSLLSASTWLSVLVAASSVPGAVVALKIAATLFNLPIALGARPGAAAQLPRLSRHVRQDDSSAFEGTYRDSISFASFIVLPASLVFLLMPETLGAAISFGTMASDAGLALVTVAIFGLGIGLMGEAVSLIATSACYARFDPRTPLEAMVIRAAITVVTIGVALLMESGTAPLMVLCFGVSLASLASAAHLHRRVTIGQRRFSRSLDRSLLADCAVSIAAVVPAALLARYTGVWTGEPELRFVVASAVLGLAAVTYLAIQWWRRSPVLTSLLGSTVASPRRERPC